MTSAVPNELSARQIAQDTFGEVVQGCERFATGLRHWVYDIELQHGRNVVVRLSHPDHRNELAGALGWTKLLRRAGVPVAAILAHDVEAAQPFLVLERLPGTDLGNVFDGLCEAELQHIASEVARWQHLTERELPAASGFGFAVAYDQPDNPEQRVRQTWAAVLDAEVDRAEGWIREAGLVDPSLVGLVRSRVAQSSELLSSQHPTPFLHDATTKNVIVHNGVVSGLVDVDLMGFGDPLYIAALTRMSLISAGRPASYAEVLAEALRPGHDGARLDLYTLIHCLSFLGEVGQSFNQLEPAPVDLGHLALLSATLQSLL